ncbi:MAG: hypothetical protein Kow0029_25480 [Candidatus Rifleibacteriota bacterium]
MPYQQIPFELEQKLQRELYSGESVIWLGVPVPRLFKPETTVAFLFSIPWTAFSIFWICGASGFSFPDLGKGFHPFMLFPLFGLPFVLIGLGMMLSPVFSYLKDCKTLYAITNQRVITITGGRTTVVNTYEPDSIQQITKNVRGNTGDLIFTHSTWKDSEGYMHNVDIGFFNIPDVDAADKALRKLLELSKSFDDDEENSGRP